MTQSHRLPEGGRIDRARPLGFTFNGRRYEGFHGDTLASALLANGVHFVARSWKYHRPRGIVTAGVDEPNAIVQLETGAQTIPNARATEVELYDALFATSVNAAPSLERDRLAILQWLGRFIPAGFYYKTFMWPRSLWPKYEGMIREAAGLGEAPRLPDPDRYDTRYAHCEVLVIGGGAKGAAAAQAASGRVILIHDGAELDDPPAARRDLVVLTRTSAFGYHDHNFVTACERLTDHLPPGERRGPRERLWKIRARRVILATGAHERPLVFGNNDLPGVMLASAVSAYIRRYAVRPGTRAVVCTNNDSAYATARDLADIGLDVTVVDSRPARPGAPEGIRVIDEAVVVEAHGGRRVERASVESKNGARVGTFDCDLLCMSGGWNPALHLYAQSGGRLVWNDERACFVAGGGGQAEVADDFGSHAVAPLWVAGRARGAKQFVDFQNDVTAADIRLAAREGYTSVEHMKRYTTLGFGTDQGKLGNINGMAILADALGRTIAETGTTTFRPNYTPVTFGLYAGRALAHTFDPVRTTCVHDWHGARGAVFEDVGTWKRPLCFPDAGEDMHAAVSRECRAVRTGVGMLDASTLGKIDIQGPDAVRLLNWVYTNAWDNLAIGRCRYGIMLDENGMVFDDGVTARLGEQHYLMTTTTGGASRVFDWMERWLQTEWPHLKVHLTSVTDHFATFAVAGPHARRVVSKACRDIDLSRDAFPFMSWREGSVAGIPARVMRISFSGELSFEVSVPANQGRRVWDALIEAGEEYGIVPYGTEAMHVLRAEKGYIIVGQDTDGSVAPHDLGMHALVSTAKDFLGKRSLSRADTAAGDRKQLVGLLAKDPAFVLPEGAQIVENPGTGIVPMIGHVTSSYASVAAGRSIALALVKRGRERIGEDVHVALPDGGYSAATIASPVFYDPEGARQRVD